MGRRPAAQDDGGQSADWLFNPLRGDGGLIRLATAHPVTPTLCSAPSPGGASFFLKEKGPKRTSVRLKLWGPPGGPRQPC